MGKEKLKQKEVSSEPDFVNPKELSQKVTISVPMTLEFEYQKRVLDFFMENSKARSISVSEVYDKLYPNYDGRPYNGGHEYYNLENFISKLEEKGVLLRSDVAYEGVKRIGYFANPKITLTLQDLNDIKALKK